MCNKHFDEQKFEAVITKDGVKKEYLILPHLIKNLMPLISQRLSYLILMKYYNLGNASGFNHRETNSCSSLITATQPFINSTALPDFFGSPMQTQPV